MDDYALQRSIENGYEYKVNKEKFPHSKPAYYDSCDWRYNRNRRGPNPAYWDFACHSACHWVVDLCLYVATTAYPSIPWRILTHQEHSTVWDGDYKSPLLFDINFSAIGVCPAQGLETAFKGRELKPGKYLFTDELHDTKNKLS